MKKRFYFMSRFIMMFMTGIFLVLLFPLVISAAAKNDRATFTKANVSYKTEFVYTGKAIRPSVVVEGYAPDEYEVYYKNNVDAGRGVIQLRKGSQIMYRYFSIKPIPLSQNTYIRELKNYAYNGKARKQTSLKIKNKKLKKLLVKGTDYKLSYINNKKVGVATVTITGKGNYSGKIVRTYVIKPGKAVISNVKKKGNSLVVTSGKMRGVTGFEVHISKTPDFRVTKRASCYNGRKVVIRNCLSDGMWYVRARAFYEYETKDGAAAAYCGEWSKVKVVF